MQNSEQKMLENEKGCRTSTEGSFQQVTPQIKHAAAALASLIRSQEGSGDKIRASALSAFLSTPKSFLSDLTPSDGEADEVDSAGEEDIIRSRSPKAVRSTESGSVDPETRARLRALLESSGIGKLSAADGISLADPEVLKRLTDQVSTAMDEAASSLLRFKAEQHHRTSGIDSPCAHSGSDVDAVELPLEESMSSPDGIEQALQGDSLLLMTCSAGFYELSQVLLALKCDVEDRGSKGDRTPLMESASGGYLDVVRLLIAHKAQVNAQSASGNTALHYAASGGFVDVARELILAGAKVEEPNENGHTPLMEAATAGQVEVAALLLSKGAKINTHSTEFKESALTLACYKGHLEMVKFLLEKGADLEHKTDEMHTALMEASMDGHVDVARLLLDHGAQVNMPTDSFESPLTLAACGGHTELAALLIDRGANLEEVNDEGYTPLMEAVREGHEEMVTLLLSRGAEVNAQTEETQETALTLACCGGFLEIAELLISSKANIELGCSTPLMEAAQEGHVRLVEYLIKSGANVNAQTFTKGTALTYACENGHTEVAEMLIQHGAELDHESEGGRTALMRASKNGHLQTVKFLVGKGACINKSTTNNDHTVVSVACANGHLQVVDFLLRSGADFSHKLKDGSTMLIEAAKGGHFDIMNLLLDWPTSGERVVASGGTNVGQISSQPSGADRAIKERTSPQADAGGTKSPAAVLAAADTVSIDESADLSTKPSNASKSLTSPCMQSVINGSSESTGGTLLSSSSSSDLAELPEDQLSWEAFFGKMASKGDLLGLGREEQIVVKQQMLDRLVQLERELQERTLTTRGKTIGGDDPVLTATLLDGSSSSVATRNRFLVVNDRLRGDEELAIAILEKAVLGETVLDQVMLDQLKAYIRGGGGDIGHGESPISDVMRNCDGRNSFDGAGGDFACIEFDNSSLDSAASSEEGEKFVDACSDEAGQYVVDGGNLIAMPQLDRLEKHIIPPQRCTLDQPDVGGSVENGQSSTSLSTQQIRTSAEGVDSSLLAKNKDRSTAKVSRRLMKVPMPPVDVQMGAAAAALSKSVSTKPGPSQAAHLSELERNLTLQQQRQHLQTQLVLQQQLHDELQQHLRLQQEHQQLQAQLKVKEGGVRPQPIEGAVVSNLSSQAQALLSPLDHQCCRHQQPCPQQRHHVQQQLLQLQHQLQQAAGHTNNESLHQAQQQAMKLAVMHQKRNSILTNSAPSAIAANNIATGVGATVTQSTQTSSTPPVIDTTNVAVKNISTNIAPVSGNAAALAAQKKASENSQNQLNASHASSSAVTSDACRPAATIRQPGAGSQARAKLLPPAPCPNCCVEGTKPGQRPVPTGSSSSSSPQTSIDVDAQTDSNHDTALTLAAAGGHARLVSLLLSRNANVEHRDKKGLTPLALAAAAGHVEVCEVLLAHKADIEAQTEKNKDTALSLACASGRLEVVTLLLSKGANKEHRNISDYTPLSQAASGGYVNVIKVLLAHGAEINSRTGSKMGISPLMLAAMNGHTAAVKLLLDMGSDINAQIETNRNTALTLACFQGRYEVVSLLIDRKANIEHRAKTGLTPLMEAASGGYVEVGRVLLDKGADIAAAPVPVSRDTALTIAADKGHHRFVELLISRGAAIDVRNKKGNTPLWLASNGGHVECVQLLVAAGSDVHAEDNRRVSCIMAAFRKAHIKVVKVLVRHVTQFPPDQDCLRYITTLSDKELVKRCHSCMTLIVSAKEQQAAEANKNAAILLEELSLEREREETKRAAAARKRDRKRLKKKERADKDREPDSGINGDGNEQDDIDSEDYTTNSNQISSVINGISALSVTPPAPNISPSDSTAKSTGLAVETELAVSESHVSKTNPTLVVHPSPASSTEPIPNVIDQSRRNNTKSKRDRQKTPADSNKNNAEVSISVPITTATSTSGESKTTVGDSSVVVTSTILKNTAEPASLSVVQPPSKVILTNSTTGIGDLDDFGSISISAPLPVAPKPNVANAKKSIPEKPRVVVVEAKNVAPNKKTSTGAVKSGAKKIGRRDDDWEEVTRKSKRLLVPATAISRVIGRGGCNINAIRDISTAQVEIDRSRDATTERIITIKGSVEATKYAQSLIEALINDTDKKFEHQLPKLKPLTSTCAQSSQKQKPSAVNGTGKASSTLVNGLISNVVSLSKEDAQKNASGKVISSISLPSAWGQPSSSVLQSKSKVPVTVTSTEATVSSAWNAATSVSRVAPEASKMTYSDRAKASAISNASELAGSWSPPVDLMANSSVEVLNTSTATTSRQEPMPLPIVVSASATLTGVSVSRPTTARDYSPFDNPLSQITESVLAKRSGDDFASVAAAGIIVTSSQLLAPTTFADNSAPYHMSTNNTTDPDLMAKAPGYRPLAGTDPSKAPGHRVGKDMSSFGPRGCMTTSAPANDNGFQSHDFGRPSSTPTAAMSLMNDASLVIRDLAASLDRPMSMYGGGNMYGPGPGLNFPPQHAHLPAFSTNVHARETFVSSYQTGVNGSNGQQQAFGTPCSLGSAVNETSVLAAPLMTTSIAPGSVMSHEQMAFDNRRVVSTTASATDVNSVPDNGQAESTNVHSPVSAEPHQIQQQQSGLPVMEDHRKPLGPIGTERAARRPPPTAQHQSDFGFPIANDLPASMWGLTSGASATWPLFSALTDPSVLAAAGLQVDNGVGLPHHSMEFPVGYQGFGGIENSGMMISDMYHMDPLVDPAAMQHMFQTGHPAMLMQFPGDIQAPYNGMLSHAPPPSYQQLNHTGFLMAPDGTNNMWGLSSQMSAANAADMPPYFNAKGQQMMWNQSWTPSANM